MLPQEERVELHALRKRGWTITAIARHLGRDRKTIRAHLRGERTPGRRRGGPDLFLKFEPYLRQRLRDDPHVWGTVLYGEARELGYRQSYPTFVRQLRKRELRPPCRACHGVKGQTVAQIEHPPGEECQWDWLELPDTPWGEKAYVLVGALSHSGRFRAHFAERMDQPHLVDGIHQVLVRLGGSARRWRVDRMATVLSPGTDRIRASFAEIAKYYSVAVDPCPPRRPNRKGVVENAIGYLTRRWWRTAEVTDPQGAQRSLDRFCEQVADRRPRGKGRTVGELAELENLLELPDVPYPAEGSEQRRVAPNALVSWRGNLYSVPPPERVGSDVLVRWRLGSDELHIQSPEGRLLATHRRLPDGQGRTVRLPEHAAALENVVLAAFGTARPCKRKLNRPPSEAALALAAEIGGSTRTTSSPIDLGVYQRYIDNNRKGKTP